MIRIHPSYVSGYPTDDTSALLALHFHSTGLCLYQIALRMTDQQPLSQFIAPPSQTWREELSHAAVNSASSIINLYISLPPTLELGFTNTQWIQLGFAMLVEYRYAVASSSTERTQAYLQTLKLLRHRVGGLSTPSIDHNGDQDVFFEFQNRIAQIQDRLDGGKKDDTPSGNLHAEESVESTQFIDPEVTLQDVNSLEWANLPQEMLGFMEGCQLLDDPFPNHSVEQVLNTWI